jgi:hypothetical protein
MIKDLEKKVTALELKGREPSLVMDVLGKMADAELDLMEEYVRTRDAGFNDEQIQEFMGERWKHFQKAAAHFEDEYERLRLMLKTR